jgi:hypothetical protein
LKICKDKRRPFPKSSTLPRKTASDPASPTGNHSSYKGGNKELNNGTIRAGRKAIQVQSPPKPAEAEIREVQTSQVQTAPQPKEETKGQTAEHPGQGERLLQAKEISQKPASQEREAEGSNKSRQMKTRTP